MNSPQLELASKDQPPSSMEEAEAGEYAPFDEELLAVDFCCRRESHFSLGAVHCQVAHDLVDDCTSVQIGQY